MELGFYSLHFWELNSTHCREQESFIRFCTKSQDLDLLQKQPKKKGIPPCWCQQRSSEELKGLSLPLPPAPARHLPLARGAQPWSQRGTRHPSSGLDKHLPSTKRCWKTKRRISLLGSGGGHSLASKDSSSHFSPLTQHLILPYVLQLGLQRPVSFHKSHLQGKFCLMGSSPQPFGTSNTISP